MLSQDPDECPRLGGVVEQKGVEDHVPSRDDTSSLEPGACGERMLVTDSELDNFRCMFERCVSAGGQHGAAADSSEASSVSTADDTAIDDAALDSSIHSLSDTAPNSLVCDDPIQSAVWRAHHKHVFIFSESGKPIYSRHGDEDRLVTLFGVMQALVAFVMDQGDVLHHIRSASHLIVFLCRPPLALVAVSRGSESVRQLALQLSRLYDQTLSVVTLTQLRRIAEQRRNFDFRKLVSGAERYLDHLLNSIDQLPSYLLESVQCLRMELLHRETVSAIVQTSCHKIKNLLFALVVCGDRLVCLVRKKKLYLHPSDFHIICNAVNSTEAFKSVEGWTPICLPKLDPHAFLYAHISYMEDDSPACLVMLTSDRENFHQLSEARATIVDRLTAAGSLQQLSDASLQHEFRLRHVGFVEMRHFMYKCTSTAQLATSAVSGVYGRAGGRLRLAQIYHVLHGRLHAPCGGVVALPLRTCHVGTSSEMAIGWLNSALEMYAVFEPYVSVAEAVALMNRLLRWITEHERSLFIMRAPVF